MFWVFIFNFQRRVRGLGNFYLEFLWFYKYSKVSIKTKIYISLKKFSNSTVFFIWLPTKYIIYYIYEFISKRTICCFSRLSLDLIKIKTDSKEIIFCQSSLPGQPCSPLIIWRLRVTQIEAYTIIPYNANMSFILSQNLIKWDLQSFSWNLKRYIF